ncbi:MAG: FAD-binding oxidoreductase [Candidatus Promineifilaceae bacterium]|nr:FAD-binding oxidoreductase [Candidatus Promineifilaceae bacterium]
MNTSYDVIFTGGGIMGCATAYFLLKNDPNLRIAILEKDATYSKNSTVLSDGNIRLQFNVKENILISQFGLQMLDRFADEMAVGDDRPDIAFRRQGDLFLTDENGCAAAQEGLTLQQSLGCPVRWLSTAEIAQHFPQMNLQGCAGGTFGEGEGTMDPHAVLQAYKNKAVSLGARFIEAEVTGLVTGRRAVHGVKLAKGNVISANVVVNTAGAWVSQIARMAGIDLPIEPVKRQVFVLEADVQPQNPWPLIVFPTGLYLIQEHGNTFLCGKSMADDPIGTDDFSWRRERFEQRLWPELVDYLPQFDRLKVVNGWAGLYAVNTFDGNAIFGEWPQMRGFYIMGGFSGHGFQQCHAGGRYIAELILGSKPVLDLSIFSPTRILENKPVFENQSKLV